MDNIKKTCCFLHPTPNFYSHSNYINHIYESTPIIKNGIKSQHNSIHPIVHYIPTSTKAMDGLPLSRKRVDPQYLQHMHPIFHYIPTPTTVTEQLLLSMKGVNPQHNTIHPILNHIPTLTSILYHPLHSNMNYSNELTPVINQRSQLTVSIPSHTPHLHTPVTTMD